MCSTQRIYARHNLRSVSASHRVRARVLQRVAGCDTTHSRVQHMYHNLRSESASVCCAVSASDSVASDSVAACCSVRQHPVLRSEYQRECCSVLRRATRPTHMCDTRTSRPPAQRICLGLLRSERERQLVPLLHLLLLHSGGGCATGTRVRFELLQLRCSVPQMSRVGWQCVAVLLQCGCSVLQCCCSVLQCVAVGCSVLQ